MNLTWHIIKKDLQRFRWAIVPWATCFLYYQLNAKLAFRSSVPMADYTFRDFIFVLAVCTYAVLSVAMIVGVVQEDNLVENTVCWRTRPISPARLLVAKLLLIEMLFVVMPLCVVWLMNWPARLTSAGILREFCFPLLMAIGLSLSFAATAACTKDLGRCMFTWLAVVGAAYLLAYWLSKVAPPLDRLSASRLIAPKLLVIFGISTVIGLAVLCSQYLLRRLVVSIALLAVGAAGAAVIGAAWTLDYLH